MGGFKTLKDLIARTKLDAIEAYTPPPSGDLPVSEAKEAWKGKVIWMNFPEAVFLRSPGDMEAYTLEPLKRDSSRGRLHVKYNRRYTFRSSKERVEDACKDCIRNGGIPVKIPS